MAIPNRPAQIRAVAKFLDDPLNESRSVDQVAALIVDGIYDLWTADEMTPPAPLDVGMAFNTPWGTRVLHVAWKGTFWTPTHGLKEHVWVIRDDSEFGTLVPTDSPQWRVIKTSKAKAGAPGNNPNWDPGDFAVARQGKPRYEILATGDRCALMRDTRNHDNIFANSNDGLARFYTREKP